MFVINQFKNKKDDTISKKRVKKVILTIDALSEDKKYSSINEKQSFFEFKDKLELLYNEGKVEELILDIDNIDLTLIQIEELEGIFEKLRTKMNIIAIGTQFLKNDYLFSLYAHKIYMFNSLNSNIILEGYNKSFWYYRKILDKLGIKVNVIHIGTHKSAGENFSRENMSPEQKESIVRIYDKLHMYLINQIKKYRNIDINEEILNGKTIFTNYLEAIDLGLIDGGSNFDKLGINYSEDTIDFNNYVSKLKNKKNKSKNEIAVIFAEGEIGPDKELNYEDMLEKIEKINDMKNVKGVLLRINSPGGSALESEKIYKELKNIEVPIFISQSSVCASGGYYISTVSRKVYSNRSTITGSIGVVALYPTFDNVLDKIGINIENITNSNIGSIFDFSLPLTNEVKDRIIKSMKDVYLEFKSHVMNARIMTDNQLEPIAGGRIWLGEEAKSIGLVDRVGGFDEALKGLVEYLKLEDYKVRYVFNEESIKEKLSSYRPSIISEKLSKEINDVLGRKGLYMLEEFKIR
jgi:signal peptide peptidase SppA, 36K type